MNCAGDLARDGDHAVSIGEALEDSDDMSQRSVRMSMLAMGSAIRMNYDLAKVREVGVCALVHDWGWHQLPARLRNPVEPLEHGDWMQVMKHPGFTIDYLQRVEGVADEISLAAFQVHEQFDGTGYPRGLSGDRIHPYARLINVVDQYLFLTSPYLGRPAIVPYDAMEYLLTQTSRGRYESEPVRALIEFLSLFPIGSHAELDDGSVVEILRQNGKDFTKPIVRLISEDATTEEDGKSIIDLASSELKIVKPVVSPGRNQMRLERETMSEILWHGPDA